MATPVRPYNLDPDFERAVTYLCATRPAFYGRLGHNLIPERLGVDACVSVLRACVAVYKETGKGPAGHEIVMQRIRNQMDAGSVTHDGWSNTARRRRSTPWTPSTSRPGSASP